MNNVVQIIPRQDDLSTIDLELDSLEQRLTDISIALVNIEQWDDDAGRRHAISLARQKLNGAGLILHRAKQISRGKKVSILN